MLDQKQILEHCYHCGNKGLLNIVGSNTHDFSVPLFDFGNIVGFESSEVVTWFLLSCPVCHQVSLFKKFEGDYVEESFEEIIYPNKNVESIGVPKQIEAAFYAALKVKGIDTSICLMSLRSTLEAICKDKGAIGKDLDSKIKDLVDKKILPETLNDACWIIRQLGNDAAHADDVIYNEYEVEQVMGFLATIINYLYTMPQKISRLKTNIKEKKLTKSETIEIVSLD